MRVSIFFSKVSFPTEAIFPTLSNNPKMFNIMINAFTLKELVRNA